MKFLVCLIIPFVLFSCATLTQEGEKVNFTYVKDVLIFQEKEATLFKSGCVFIRDLEASIAMGDQPIDYRLQIGLRNEAGKSKDGNYILSSLTQIMGMPIKTKGKLYKCPEGAFKTDF